MQVLVLGVQAHRCDRNIAFPVTDPLLSGNPRSSL